MPILNHTGFESGELATESAATAGTLSIVSSTARNGTWSLRVNPTTTAVGNFRLTQYGATGAFADLNIANAYQTLGFKYAVKPAVNSEQIIRFLNTAAAIKGSVCLTSGGLLEARNQAGTLVATGTKVLQQDVWYEIGIFCPTSASAAMLVYVDRVLDITATSNYSTTNHQRVQLGKIQDLNGNTVDFFYDDVCLADDAFYYGRGLQAVPIGAGAASGWTNGTGSTFAEANEVPPNTTTYIQASATQDNTNHTFDMQTASTIGIGNDRILSVKTLVRALTGSITGTSDVAHRRLVSGTPFQLTSLELAVTYATLAVVDNTSPVDASAWDITKFNTIEVGMSAGTLAQTQRFTVAYIQVFVESLALLGTPYGPLGELQQRQLLSR